MRILVATVGLVLAALLAPVVIVSMWAAHKVDDADAYVATVAPLASDPALRQQFGEALGTAAAEKLAQRSPIGVPAAAGGWIRTAAVGVVNQPGFPRFWRRANREVHRQFMAQMQNRSSNPTGYVYVDATPLLNQIFAQLADKGLPTQLLAGVPLQIPVAGMSRLEQQRTHYDWLMRTARYGPWVWLVLVVLSVLIAPGWRGRMRAIAFAAFGVALGGLLAMVSPHPLASYAASHAGVGDTALVHLLAKVVLDSLGRYGRPYLLVGVLVGLVALLLSLVPMSGRRRQDRDWQYAA
ncbi:MAG: hypothetical protein FWE71_08685 [Nocardioidaceae bacterium]|nr:hypothetical protein [Nocardioidaceae bacterium]MCL2612948.1 hypothetical protein [Nocardioidaceae bacterium]